MRTIENFKNSVLKIKTGEEIKVYNNVLSNYTDKTLKRVNDLFMFTPLPNHYLLKFISDILKCERKPFKYIVKNFVFYKIVNGVSNPKCGYKAETEEGKVKEARDYIAVFKPLTSIFLYCLINNINDETNIDDHETCVRKIKTTLEDMFNPLEDGFSKLDNTYYPGLYRFVITLRHNVLNLSKIIYKFLYLIKYARYSKHLETLNSLLQDFNSLINTISKSNDVIKIKTTFVIKNKGETICKEVMSEVSFTKEKLFIECPEIGSIVYNIDEEFIYNDVIKGYSFNIVKLLNGTYTSSLQHYAEFGYEIFKNDCYSLTIHTTHSILNDIKDCLYNKCVIENFSSKFSEEEKIITKIEFDFTNLINEFFKSKPEENNIISLKDVDILAGKDIDKKFHFIAKNIECFKKLNFGFRESEMSDSIVKFQKLYDFYYTYNQNEIKAKDIKFELLAQILYKIYELIFNKCLDYNIDTYKTVIEELNNLIKELQKCNFK